MYDLPNFPFSLIRKAVKAFTAEGVHNILNIIVSRSSLTKRMSMMKNTESQARKRPNPSVWEASENHPRSPSSMSMDQDSVENYRLGHHGNADRSSQNETGYPASEPANGARLQEQIGRNGEAEGSNGNSGPGKHVSNKFEDVSGSGNIFEAIGRWGDAVRIMSSSLERDACGSLMNEIAGLQQDVVSRRLSTPGTTLRAFVDSPLPGLCLRVMGELEQNINSEAPFAEHVSSILDTFVCIQDPTCTGQHELADALSAKRKELKDLCAQAENHQKEREKIRSEQHQLAEETMHDLETTTDSLLNLYSEKERIENLLNGVRMKAAQQRAILESNLEKSGRSVQQVQAEVQEENLASRDNEPVSSGMSDKQHEKAQAIVTTVQDHINIVYRTADFVKEARTCIGSLVHSMIIKSLQQEIETLSQDKEHGIYLKEHLKKSPAGPPSLSAQRGPMTSSIAFRYKSFYCSQLQNMAARHVLSRYAVDGLIAHLEENKSVTNSRMMESDGIDSMTEKNSEIKALALQVVKKIEDLQDHDMAFSENASVQVPKSAKGSTLALFAGSLVSQSAIALLQCAAALETLALQPVSAGRLIVRSTTATDDKLAHICNLVLALGRHGTVPADSAGEMEKEFKSAAHILWDALDSVLGGRCRNSVCVIHSTDTEQILHVEDSRVDQAESNVTESLCLSSIVGALIQSRMQYSWLAKIAIINLLEPFDTAHPSMKSTGIQLFSVPLFSEPARNEGAISSTDGQNEILEHSGEKSDVQRNSWTKALDSVSNQVTDFTPDLIIVLIPCLPSKQTNETGSSDAMTHSHFSRKLLAEDWSWAGKSLESLAGRLCNGRIVVVWDLIGRAQLWHSSVADLTSGMLQDSG